jgi:hypothetical protein
MNWIIENIVDLSVNKVNKNYSYIIGAPNTSSCMPVAKRRPVFFRNGNQTGFSRYIRHVFPCYTGLN